MKRKLCLLLCLILILITAAGCTQETQQDEPEPPAMEDTDSSPEAMMAPGTYTAQAYGFSMSWPDILRVTVSENAIESIAFDQESGSTSSMIDAVAAAMFPRILENQSVNVDIVSGATVTSVAARTAIEDCLKQAIVAAGNEESAISEFKKPQEKSGGSQELETQVLVIGMGGGGTYTALRAAEEGVDVLVIEKQGRYGGTTALTSEIQSINPPRIKEKYNNGEDFTDADAMYEAWTEYTEGDAKKEMLDLYFEKSGPALDWLALDHGAMFDFDPKPGFTPADWYKVKFQWYPNTSPEHPDAPTHGYNKREIASYFDKLVEDFTELGGQYMLETEAYELITDDTGAVVGAKAKNKLTGTEYTIKADAVVIATGGFLGSREMTSEYLSNEYFPLKGAWKIYGSYGNDGKMIQSAIDIGAATYNIGMPPEVHMSGSDMFIPHSYGFAINKVEGQKSFNTGKQSVWSVADLPMFLGITPNSLAVGMDGERFTSETGVAMLDPWIAGPNFYSIWSSEQINDIRDNGFKHFLGGVSSGFLGYTGDIPVNTPLPEAYDVLDAGIEMGFIYKADTIEELAKAIDIDPSALKNTVESYNNYCKNGKDEQFNKDAEYLEAIGEGPYYAIKMASYSYNTCAGLDVNTKLQVLNTSGEPIEGLFCVGSDCAGVLFTEKKPYVTYGGANNGWVLTSAYVCGEAVADYVSDK
ncbi:MAG: FAD-dependent oxidoreductase [Tissierellia bacterium]|mgnify:CR=1 FL=1|nr:FAD-dependent oxidoreductase [Tissierellia bacterium]